MTLHGASVTTVEGIGSNKTKLHPVQERIALAHGTQCGYCTPGFVMSMYTLLRNNVTPSMNDITNHLSGRENVIIIQQSNGLIFSNYNVLKMSQRIPLLDHMKKARPPLFEAE